MTNNSILPLSGGVSQATSAVSSSLEISTQDFLKLLVAQSKYQDPLSPKDPGDTLQQLASLAGVS
ncbi:MAG TPA: flagellar hook capping FlgD N-terminal domain-containing protein, partial [Oxalicibacterium sp.]